MLAKAPKPNDVLNLNAYQGGEGKIRNGYLVDRTVRERMLRCAISANRRFASELQAIPTRPPIGLHSCACRERARILDRLLKCPETLSVTEPSALFGSVVNDVLGG